MKDFGSIRLNALAVSLKPLVRMLMRGSHTIQEFIEVLKYVFVEVAVDEVRKKSQKINVSRICMVTGIHRIEVNRIYKEREEGSLKKPINNLFRIIGQWTEDERFLTKSKRPRVLSFGGDNNEFKELCDSVSKSIIAGTALFELERIGAVKRTRNGVKLIKKEIIWEEETDKFRVMARGIEALIAAIEQNVLGVQEGDENYEPNLYMITEYDNVFQEELLEIREWMREEGIEFHSRVRDVVSEVDKDISGEGREEEPAGAKATICTFTVTDLPEREEQIEDKAQGA